MSAVALCFERLENGARDLSLLSTCSSEILNNGSMLERQRSETVVIKVITHLFAEAKVFIIYQGSQFREFLPGIVC